MKRISLFIFFLMAAVVMNAANIDKVAASRVARTFASEKGLMMNLQQEPIVYSTTAGTMDAASAPVFYAFNAADEKGFVLVAAQDCEDNVLGYCTSGTFSADNLPSNMRFWIEGMSREMVVAAETGQLTTFNNAIPKAAIEPLCTSTWNQDAPYNNYCPVYSGQRCPTGCLATALAQVMYYHKWPTGQVNSIPGYRTDTKRINRPDLPATTFDWTSMRDNYRSTDTDGDAVAELMNYVGQAVFMDYTPEGSGASEYIIPNAISEYFGYPKSAKRLARSLYTISQWEDIVYNEIACNRPVLYCGYTPNWEGHAFVCDGYDGNGMFHINWGWGGYGDGYFRLAVLNPYNTSSSGAASTDDGFSEGQVIVAGIQPAAGAEIAQPWPLSSLSYANTSITAKIQAIAGGSHQVALVTIDDNGNMTPVMNPVTRTFYTNSTSSVTFNISSLAAGDYDLYVAVRANGTEEWTKVGGVTQYAEVHVSAAGGITTVMHPVFDVVVTNMRFPKSVIVGHLSSVEFSLKNNADEFEGKLFVACGPNNSMTTQCGSVNVGMMPGDEYTTSISVVPPVTDNLTVWVATDEKFNNIIGQHTFCNYDITVAGSVVEWDPTKVTITLKNNSASPYNNQIYANIYQDGVKKALGSLTYDVEIPSGGTTNIECTLNFDKAKKYYITLQHITGELNATKKTISEKVYVQYDANGIAEIIADPVTAKTYTISGQQVRDDYKGIVIQNGKKTVRR